MKASRVALLVVGQEILNGSVTDANIVYTAKKFSEKGVVLAKVEIVPDEIDSIAESVKRLSQKYDFVITAGGMGPTHDDVTVEGVAKALDQQVIKHSYLETVISRHYKGAVLTAAQSRMAMVPAEAELLVSTSPSEDYFLPQIYVKNIYLLPGLPKLFSHYLDYIMPAFTGVPLLHDEVSIKGIETKLTAALNRSVHKFPQVRFGSYPSFEPGQPDSFIVKITFEAPDETSLTESKEFFLKQLPQDLTVMPN
ncbi:MAG: competence/damage-inducible protein A [Candidatus Bruticola sp.]